MCIDAVMWNANVIVHVRWVCISLICMKIQIWFQQLWFNPQAVHWTWECQRTLREQDNDFDFTKVLYKCFRQRQHGSVSCQVHLLPSYRHSLKLKGRHLTLRLATRETWPWRGKLGTTCGNNTSKQRQTFHEATQSDTGTVVVIMTWPADPGTLWHNPGSLLVHQWHLGNSNSLNTEALWDLLIARQFSKRQFFVIRLIPGLTHLATSQPPLRVTVSSVLLDCLGIQASYWPLHLSPGLWLANGGVGRLVRQLLTLSLSNCLGEYKKINWNTQLQIPGIMREEEREIFTFVCYEYSFKSKNQ